MTVPHRVVFLVVLFMSLSAYSSAQASVLSPPDSLPASHWRLQLVYTSDDPYLGRVDSANVPYLSPSVFFSHKSGLFGAGMVSYLVSGDAQRLDRAVFSAGYTHFGNRLSTGAKASMYLYDEESYAIRAEMSGAIAVQAEADLSVVSVFAEGGVGFSRNTDFFAGIEINKPFYMLRYRLQATPLVYISAGTQHYYDAYMVYRSVRTGAGSGKGKGGNTQPPVLITEVTGAEAFQLRDFGTSLKLSYVLGRLRAISSATLSVPLNPVEVVSDQGGFMEDQGVLFIWSLGAGFTFR